MDNFKATMIAEGEFGLADVKEDEITEELILEAWQHLVDTGLAWSLQGRFGRIATNLIEDGLIKKRNENL